MFAEGSTDLRQPVVSLGVFRVRRYGLLTINPGPIVFAPAGGQFAEPKKIASRSRLHNYRTLEKLCCVFRFRLLHAQIGEPAKRGGIAGTNLELCLIELLRTGFSSRVVHVRSQKRIRQRAMQAWCARIRL